MRYIGIYELQSQTHRNTHEASCPFNTPHAIILHGSVPQKSPSILCKHTHRQRNSHTHTHTGRHGHALKHIPSQVALPSHAAPRISHIPSLTRIRNVNTDVGCWSLHCTRLNSGPAVKYLKNPHTFLPSFLQENMCHKTTGHKMCLHRTVTKLSCAIKDEQMCRETHTNKSSQISSC